MYVSDYTITSKHYLVHFVCAFALGIYLAILFGIIFAIVLCLLIFFIALLICGTAKILGNYKTKYLILSLVLVSASLMGIFRVCYAEYVQSDLLRKYHGQEIWLCGTVTSDPQLTSSGYYRSFELDVSGIANHTGSFGTVMMYVPCDFACNFSSGDNIYAWTSLNTPDNHGHSSHFDYYTHLRGKNIFLTGTAKALHPLPQDSIKPTLFVRLKSMGGWVRRHLSYSIKQIFADNPVCSAILSGILIGDKTGFDDELYQKFSYSGISHIVAVSGLHMSIFFSFLMIASNHLFLSRRFNLLAAIPAILLFASASGFTPSVCRASVMILITICSTLLREKYNPATSLFLALGLILAATPYSLFSKSLILSFFATLGIISYYPHIISILNQILYIPCFRLKKRVIIRNSLSYIFSSLSLSLSTLIGTSYFLTIFFGGISKAQFLTNLWIIPLVSIIFYLGYACCILYYICPFLATYLLKPALKLCLDIVRHTVDTFGTAECFLSIYPPGGVDAILYFGTALMLYMLLKTVGDMYIQRKRTSR